MKHLAPGVVVAASGMSAGVAHAHAGDHGVFAAMSALAHFLSSPDHLAISLLVAALIVAVGLAGHRRQGKR